VGEGPEGWGAVGAAARGRRGLIGWRQGGGCVDEGRKKAARGGYNPDPPPGKRCRRAKKWEQAFRIEVDMFPLFSDECLRGPPASSPSLFRSGGTEGVPREGGGKGKEWMELPLRTGQGTHPPCPKAECGGGGWVEQWPPPLSSGVPPSPPPGRRRLPRRGALPWGGRCGRLHLILPNTNLGGHEITQGSQGSKKRGSDPNSGSNPTPQWR